MARVNTAKKIRSGKAIRCGRPGCGEQIIPGEKYYFWEPRYGPKHVRCYRHYPKQSETTTSKMADVYAATEDAEEWAGAYDGTEVDEYTNQIEAVKDVAEQVKGEYEDAAEQFGNAGTAQELAEALEEFIAELEGSDFEDFETWKSSHDDEDPEESWREDMLSRMTEVLSTIP